MTYVSPKAVPIKHPQTVLPTETNYSNTRACRGVSHLLHHNLPSPTFQIRFGVKIPSMCLQGHSCSQPSFYSWRSALSLPWKRTVTVQLFLLYWNRIPCGPRWFWTCSVVRLTFNLWSSCLSSSMLRLQEGASTPGYSITSSSHFSLSNSVLWLICCARMS